MTNFESVAAPEYFGALDCDQRGTLQLHVLARTQHTLDETASDTGLARLRAQRQIVNEQRHRMVGQRRVDFV